MIELNHFMELQRLAYNNYGVDYDETCKNISQIIEAVNKCEYTDIVDTKGWIESNPCINKALLSKDFDIGTNDMLSNLFTENNFSVKQLKISNIFKPGINGNIVIALYKESEIMNGCTYVYSDSYTKKVTEKNDENGLVFETESKVIDVVILISNKKELPYNQKLIIAAYLAQEILRIVHNYGLDISFEHGIWYPTTNFCEGRIDMYSEIFAVVEVLHKYINVSYREFKEAFNDHLKYRYSYRERYTKEKFNTLLENDEISKSDCDISIDAIEKFVDVKHRVSSALKMFNRAYDIYFNINQ